MDEKAQHRVFHEEDAELPAGSSAPANVGSNSSDATLISMRAGIVGRLAQFTSPFGGKIYTVRYLNSYVFAFDQSSPSSFFFTCPLLPSVLALLSG